MQFPKLASIQQHFDPQHIEDVPRGVREELAALSLSEKVRPGQSVAIAAGSRGIAHLDVMVKTIVETMKALGAKPFIFPAMGSHGGATAEGQERVLAGLGITETTMGCPLLSHMEPDYLGDASLGYPIYVDKHAGTADHIVVVNRVKAHTKFEGPIESGLMKMMAIGMGKHIGAQFYHKASIRLTFQRIVETVGLEVMKRCPVLFGLGVVENAYHQTCLIKALPAEEIPEGEKKLLIAAKKRMARLPFDDIDVLIVDRIGKDISGTGMDINVTGRNRDLLGDFHTSTRVKRIYVRDLTDQTEGNATGIGLADFTHARLVAKMDRHKTYINAITGISPEKGAIPMYYDTDREALEACFNTIGDIPAHEAGVIRIKDTMSLEKIQVSKAYEDRMIRRSDLEIRGAWEELGFDGRGELLRW